MVLFTSSHIAQWAKENLKCTSWQMQHGSSNDLNKYWLLVLTGNTFKQISDLIRKCTEHTQNPQNATIKSNHKKKLWQFPLKLRVFLWGSVSTNHTLWYNGVFKVEEMIPLVVHSTSQNLSTVPDKMLEILRKITTIFSAIRLKQRYHFHKQNYVKTFPKLIFYTETYVTTSD